MSDPFGGELGGAAAAGVPAREQVGPGYWMLGVAVASLLLSALTLVDDSRGVQFVGYVLAAPVPFTLVALFRRRATARLFSAGIGVPASVSSALLLLLVAGFACSFFHALLIARHYG
jgi:hypothetical protein